MDLQTLESPTPNSAGSAAVSLSTQQRQALEKALPFWRIVFNQFKEHRMAVAGSFVILFFVLISFGASLISSITGLDPSKQNVAARYLPPMSEAEASSDVKEFEIERWITTHREEANQLAQTLIDQQLIMASTDLDAVIYDLASKPRSEALDILKNVNSAPSLSLQKTIKTFKTFHVFGTDEVGRDVLIRLIYGTQVSMGVGILVAIASALIGFLIGALAGFYGGFIDAALMRTCDALQSLPIVPVLIVVAAVDLQKLPALKSILSVGNESILKMVLILVLFSWMTVARLVRGSILSLREREFILASRTLGAQDRTIIFKHMLPNVIAPMLVAITLGVGQSILFEAALSFLGLGIMPPTPSWGNMLNNAQEVIYKNMWLTILPGLMILFTTISFNFVGDGLQDAVDPKSIRR